MIHTLTTLIDQLEAKSKQVLQSIATTQIELSAAKQRLSVLQDYSVDYKSGQYTIPSSQNTTELVSGARLKGFGRFLNKLEEAVQGQQSEINTLFEQLSSQNEVLRGFTIKKRQYETLRTRLTQEKELAAARKLQKETDEIASRLLRTKQRI